MRSIPSRAPVRSRARSDLLDRQFGRYRPPVQAAVRALAAQNSRLADLALSFPALLFALAVPRPGFDPACAIGRIIEGASLAEVASAADVAFWLRGLRPESLSIPLPQLPDDPLFRRRIANHFPKSKIAATWLQAISEMTDLADAEIALWIAAEIDRESKSVKLEKLRRVGLWAWFSTHPDTLGHSMIDKSWKPCMRFRSALEAADDWWTTVGLYVHLGREPIADSWVRCSGVDGYDFYPLSSAAQIVEEAEAMGNCLRTYGYNVAHNHSRLWSVWYNGRRIATLCIGFRFGDPLPLIVQLKGPRNADAPVAVWWAARQWLNGQDLLKVKRNQHRPKSAPLDRATWTALWRPYWMAKRRIPYWLPLAPSRAALDAL